MTLLRWLAFLFGSLTVTLTVLLFQTHLFLLILPFILKWLFFHWEIPIILLSNFHWFFVKIKSGCPTSSRTLSLFLCWLVLSSWWFDICSMGKYLQTCCFWCYLWMGLGSNWCIYNSSKISCQTSLISMVFSCLCCCHSS